MMKFFTADTHFGHERILEFTDRPFKGIMEHDAYLIDQINAHVEPKDELFILGDFCWDRPGHYRQRIKCRTVHLIWGNHDKQNYGKHFSTTDDVRMVRIGRISNDLNIRPMPIDVFLSHYAHAFWPSSHHGSLHLYGHTHDQREQTLDNQFPGRRSMDCGVDVAKRVLGDYRPFCEIKIIACLLTQPGHDSIEFYKKLRGGQ